MENLFRQFNSLNILIVGDVMIDAYLWGKVDRISPEAPVPVVSINKRENRLGGAANVALNVRALGANPIICAVTGDDLDAAEFNSLLNELKLSTEGIIKDSSRPTTVKTRVIGHSQQIVRIDSENDELLAENVSQSLLQTIRQIVESRSIHAIIFEDYDKGVLSPHLIAEIVTLANQKQIITVVDPKKRNFLDYKDVTLFKPNLKELREGLKISIDASSPNEVEDAISLLQDKLNCNMAMVTLSEHGVYISSAKGKQRIPAHIRNIADVSGAGDTVIATTAVCLAAGIDEFTTAAIANLAGGLVCEHVGVVPIDKELLLNEAKKKI